MRPRPRWSRCSTWATASHGRAAVNAGQGIRGATTRIGSYPCPLGLRVGAVWSYWLGNVGLGRAKFSPDHFQGVSTLPRKPSKPTMPRPPRRLPVAAIGPGHGLALQARRMPAGASSAWMVTMIGLGHHNARAGRWQCRAGRGGCGDEYAAVEVSLARLVRTVGSKAVVAGVRDSESGPEAEADCGSRFGVHHKPNPPGPASFRLNALCVQPCKWCRDGGHRGRLRELPILHTHSSFPGHLSSSQT